jgi:D-alanyl-D-alanine carboxypeptidase
MFRQPELDQGALISWTLRNQPLLTQPGTTYAYSNFGYCVLGRVIEKLTHRSYESLGERPY